MTEYLTVKPSQIHLFKTIPFYFQSKDKDFVLYKKGGDSLGHDRANNTRHPPLFILGKDKDQALKELTTALNRNLAQEIDSGGFVQVKDILCQIVHEALVPNQEKAMESLPETIEILLGKVNQDHGERLSQRSQRDINGQPAHGHDRQLRTPDLPEQDIQKGNKTLWFAADH